MPSMSSPVLAYTYNKVVPLYPGAANQVPVNLTPNTTFLAGHVLGQLSVGATNDVQTVTISGSPTGGTFTLSGTNPVTGASTSYTGPYNAATSAVQTGLNAIYGTGNVTVTGTAGASYVLTAGGTLAGRPIPLLVATHALTGGSSPSIAIVKTATGGSAGTWGIYNQGNSDGTQNPQLILEYDCITDASGQITYASAFGGGGRFQEIAIAAPAYYAGTFRTADLPNYDANCNGKLGKLIHAGAIRLF